MLHGHQTWEFFRQPVILATGVVGGPMEAQGPLAQDFDILHGDLWLGQDSFEKAEKKMLEQACEKAIEKAGLKKEDIQFFLSGDLMNQIISSSFCARTLGAPYLGLFGACSTSMEGLALASLIIDSQCARYVLCGTASHNASVEKQFRYPTEYGGQKPPSAQWTVTGAGTAVVGAEGEGPRVKAATIGRVVDMAIADPFNMGAAMAPAAVDTIEAHFRDMNTSPADYDLIATGDLGQIGHHIAKDLLKKHGFDMGDTFTDCGLLIYSKDQKNVLLAGASGAGCSASVAYGHILNRMRKGELNKVMIVATGALLSPISFQQNETIPCIAHAVVIENVR